MRSAYLVGPFVGELTWEFYRFAPYIITLKKRRPKLKIIVYTRASRFDLYGKHADILVPLKIPGDSPRKQKGFTMLSLTDPAYQELANRLSAKYKPKYNIIEHIYPEISFFYHRFKWQYPRELMDYNFRPRTANIEFARKYVGNHKVALVNFNFSEKHQITEMLEDYGYFPIFINMLTEEFHAQNKKGMTLLGCIIEVIRRSGFVISKFNTHVSHLSLLLKTPVVCVGKKPSNDSVLLANPFKTKVVYCENEEEGIGVLCDLSLI